MQSRDKRGAVGAGHERSPTRIWQRETISVGRYLMHAMGYETSPKCGFDKLTMTLFTVRYPPYNPLGVTTGAA